MTTTHDERSAAAHAAAAPPRGRGRKSRKGGDARSQRRLAALLLSPTLLVLALVIGYPVLAGFRESLFARGEGLDENGFVVEGTRFVGLDNYTAIFSGDSADAFWNAFGNTSFFTFTTVILETVIGVGMALIMHQAFRGRAFVRASILVRGRSRPRSPACCGGGSSRRTAPRTRSCGSRSCGRPTVSRRSSR
ncbi:hypothetical protein BJF79_12460 [Actinomadura sp. CNU-125]|uniref:carbohydrate ABC transporter permease n=1 Tax=Actinomadura sp. CNU-125 TaxID=1904961 RepID=UPI0009627035|nr:sugar ABC transporter permease [Actinomadura sp. CNU-125]OLT25936.1 hypothetical protein BJF79_12460 [Actinomadura sp. CNU-125]